MLKTKLGRKYALWQSNKQQELIQEEVRIQEFLDMIAPSIIKFNTDHFISCNTYQCVWALREYPKATDEQAILRHLVRKTA